MITEVLNEIFLLYITDYMVLFTELVEDANIRYEFGKILSYQIIIVLCLNVFFIFR